MRKEKTVVLLRGGTAVGKEEAIRDRQTGLVFRLLLNEIIELYVMRRHKRMLMKQ